jgi:hypothetical protein
MELSEYVAALQEELTAITRVAGEDAARVAALITHTLEPSVRLTLLEVLSAAAADITSRLDGPVVELRLSGGEPAFVVEQTPDIPAAPAPAPPEAEPDDTGLARVTLRLPESLKARVEDAAAQAGVSVNNWLVQAAKQALDGPRNRPAPPFRPGIGQRITGFARS